MKLFLGTITLVVAVLISAIAGYFSIVGLAALFAARALPVIIMGSALEVGKLVAATWLKLNWKERSVAWLHKGYLLIATLVLMLITSLGIFGFLSAGHLEQNAPLAGLSIQQQQYQVQLDQTTATNKRIEGRLAQIDTNINAFLTAGSATKGLRASATLKKERETLAAEMEANNKIINDLNAKLAPIKQQSTEVEAKLGPVKYLASAMGYENPEVAVNLVILLIMIAFDPLAVVLIISAMATFKQIADEKAERDTFVETLLDKAVTVDAGIDLNFDAFDEPEPVSGTAAAMIQPALNLVIEPVEQIPGRFVVGEEIPVTIGSDLAAHVQHPRLSPSQIADMMAQPKVEEAPLPDDPKEIRNLLIDLMEQYPDIVNDLLATAKEMEAGSDDTVPFNPTISNVTGATVADRN